MFSIPAAALLAGIALANSKPVDKELARFEDQVGLSSVLNYRPDVEASREAARNLHKALAA